MRPSKLFQRLVKSNSAPTEEERTLLESEVVSLKAEFQQIASMPFTPLPPTSIQGDTPSKGLIKIHKSILKRVGVLSCIRSVPAEIWQNIFTFALVNIDNLHPRNPYDKALRALCNVCTLWRAAAVRQQRLWIKFPIFEFGHAYSSPTSLQHQGRTLKRLEQYLANSGTCPFTFGFILHHDRHLLDTYVFFAYTVLKLLVKECQRWEGALLYLARYNTGGKWPVDLLPIKGRLPVLSRLDLTVAAKTNDEWSQLSSLFSSAPKLRHVVFNTPRHGVTSANTYFDLSLPWAQLSTFDGLSYSYSSNSLLHFLSESQSPNATLTSLRIGSIQIQPPISPPVTLTKLTTLHIQLNSPDGRLWLAAMLVVPSLQSLSVHGGAVRPRIPLCCTIRDLILASQCHLNRLALVDFREPLRALGLFDEFKAYVFRLCPLLTELDIPSACVSARGSLMQFGVDPDDPDERLVPLLKILTLRSDARDSGSAWVVDPEELISMFTFSEVLEEVRFVHSSPHGELGKWNEQLDRLDMAPPRAFSAFKCADFILPEILGLWKEDLGRLCRAEYSTSEFLNIKRQREANAFLKVLEEYNMWNCDTRNLARRGIIHLLHEIGVRQDGTIPGDKLFNFRRRAGALLDKWKPDILRLYQLSPYRWYRLTDSSAILKRVSPEVPESEGELWAEILGQGPQAERSRRGLEEPWRSLKLLDGFFDHEATFQNALAAGAII